MKICFITLSVLILMSCTDFRKSNSTTKTKEIDSVPSNPNATVEAKAVLQVLADITAGKIKGTIPGQNCFHGIQITPYDNSSYYSDGYRKMVEKLFQDTGKYVGLLGIDYEYDQIFTLKQLSAANKILMDFSKAGGLVMVTWSPQNPYYFNELDIEKNPGDNRDNYKTDGVFLNDLIDPAKPISKVWRRKLDRIASALTELREAGVPVLFRPMQENNGNWFWWGIKSHPSDPKPFINLYRDMYRYFTEEKGLSNLLWVYSPGNGYSSPWMNAVNWEYPGDDVVDVFAGTSYNNSLTIDDYQTYASSGKPIGVSEYGPDSRTSVASDGTLDDQLYVERVQKSYPGMAFFQTWHGWMEGPRTVKMALIDQKNPKEMMNNPYLLTREKLKVLIDTKRKQN